VSENISAAEQVPLWKRKDFIFGMALALLIWGLQLIGVTVNVWLGAGVLALAFGLVARSFWAWEGPSRWHIAWRSLTILVAAGLYAAIIIPQIKKELAREHPSLIAQKPPSPVAPLVPPTETNSKPPNEKPKTEKPHIVKRTPDQKQSGGKDNVQTGPITQGPCSNLQVGGSQNSATTNCGPPPLEMSASSQTVPTDKEGLVKTIITITPNVPVPAPTSVAVEFDNPVSSMGFWVAGAAGVIGGGPYRNGVHGLISIGTGFSAQHPLLLTVYSEKPVRVIQPPKLE
jgi:hypothetical protein